jgi:uncharacterized repeat protein (TIGR01451 family)
MKYIKIILLSLFCISFVDAQVLNLTWLNTLGGSGNDNSVRIKEDSLQNVWIIGSFTGTVDFDPGPNTVTRTSAGSIDAFVLKLDPNGNFLWVEVLGGSGDDYARDIVIDHQNNILVFGDFSSSIDLDPSAATLNFSSQGGRDIFMQKLDNNGNLIWGKTIQGSNDQVAQLFTVDSNNDIYFALLAKGTLDLDPSATTAFLSSNGNFDAVVGKWDANGNYQWGNIYGSSLYETAQSAILINNKIYVTGVFQSTVDFGGQILSTQSGTEAYVLKLDLQGNSIWAKSISGSGNIYPRGTEAWGTDGFVMIGYFNNSADFDLSSGTTLATAVGADDAFVAAYDTSGAINWLRTAGSSGEDKSFGLSVGADKSVCWSGIYSNNADFGNGTILASNGGTDAFVQKLDMTGNVVWEQMFGGTGDDNASKVYHDSESVLVAGEFEGVVDFDPTVAVMNATSAGQGDVFIFKMSESGIQGQVFHDFNQNCNRESNEVGLAGRNLIIQPANIVVTTDQNGIWSLDSLPAGNYSITIDTTQGSWSLVCLATQSFSVSGGQTTAPDFGLISNSSCPQPQVSIQSNSLRRGFPDERIYVQACNDQYGTAAITNAYTIVTLDSFIQPHTASLPYTALGNNQYQVNLGDLNPGECMSFYFEAQVSLNPVLGQTTCMQAELFPVDSCALDTTPNPYPIGTTISPCNTPWDKSSLQVNGECIGDSIKFTIINTGDPGDGDMSCFAPVRLYIDGQYVLLDSIQLNGGDTAVFCFAGDGRTWRLEADQHPLHPGNSHPNASVELCGNAANWTPGLIGTMPLDDADPIIDQNCAMITGAFDPNDKTGFPLGLTPANNIQPNQDLEYLIRFQNTGNDTAFTVVIRDTLPTELDLFSVVSGVSSHDYEFRMYGNRILEWTFNNIMLPDSNVNEAASHGFVRFNVNQEPNLAEGTTIENSAAIYFDFNAPIITNTYLHTIKLPEPFSWDGEQTLNPSVCDLFSFNGIVYDQSGTYYQAVENNGLDSLYTINLVVGNNESSFSATACDSYDWNGLSYSNSGSYQQIFTNAAGCDSTVTLDLTVNQSESTYFAATVCDSIMWAGQVFYTSGIYSQTYSTTTGCDSVVSLNLTVNQSSDLNTSVTQMGLTLTADASALTYQWLDCDNNYAPIPNANNQTFEATANGNYAVEVSNGSCSAISACYNITGVGLENVSESVGPQIYPNPTTSNLNIIFETLEERQLQLMTFDGRILKSLKLSDQNVEIDMSTYPSGVYLIKIIKQASGSKVYKVVKG